MFSRSVSIILTTISSLMSSNSSLSMSTTNTRSHAAAAGLSSRLVQRDFVFVPYGSSASSSVVQQQKTLSASLSAAEKPQLRPTISCDGRVSGVTLELTHWTNNQTPDRLYADTSTEMALKLAQACVDSETNQNSNEKLLHEYDYLKNALVLNNHYDTDGVLSTFACLEPELALQHADLLVRAAEAGDFGEWNTDAGVQLNLALEAWLERHSSNDEEAAYKTALAMMPDLLRDFQFNQGENFKHLWDDAWKQLLQDYDYLANNLEQTVTPSVICPKDLAIVIEPPQQTSGIPPTSSYAIYRALQESGHWPQQMGIGGSGPIRILRARPSVSDRDDAMQSFHYNYEMIGHGWVQRLIQRRQCPEVPSVDELIHKLNLEFDDSTGAVWKRGGVSGLVSICQTMEAVPVTPQDMASRLATLDPVLAEVIGTTAVE